MQQDQEITVRNSQTKNQKILKELKNKVEEYDRHLKVFRNLCIALDKTVIEKIANKLNEDQNGKKTQNEFKFDERKTAIGNLIEIIFIELRKKSEELGLTQDKLNIVKTNIQGNENIDYFIANNNKKDKKKNKDDSTNNNKTNYIYSRFSIINDAIIAEFTPKIRKKIKEILNNVLKKTEEILSENITEALNKFLNESKKDEENFLEKFSDLVDTFKEEEKENNFYKGYKEIRKNIVKTILDNESLFDNFGSIKEIKKLRNEKTEIEKRKGENEDKSDINSRKLSSEIFRTEISRINKDIETKKNEIIPEIESKIGNIQLNDQNRQTLTSLNEQLAILEEYEKKLPQKNKNFNKNPKEEDLLKTMYNNFKKNFLENDFITDLDKIKTKPEDKNNNVVENILYFIKNFLSKEINGIQEENKLSFCLDIIKKFLVNYKPQEEKQTSNKTKLVEILSEYIYGIFENIKNKREKNEIENNTKNNDNIDRIYNNATISACLTFLGDYCKSEFLRNKKGTLLKELKYYREAQNREINNTKKDDNTQQNKKNDNIQEQNEKKYQYEEQLKKILTIFLKEKYGFNDEEIRNNLKREYKLKVDFSEKDNESKKSFAELSGYYQDIDFSMKLGDGRIIFFEVDGNSHFFNGVTPLNSEQTKGLYNNQTAYRNRMKENLVNLTKDNSAQEKIINDLEKICTFKVLEEELIQEKGNVEGLDDASLARILEECDSSKYSVKMLREYAKLQEERRDKENKITLKINNTFISMLDDTQNLKNLTITYMFQLEAILSECYLQLGKNEGSSFIDNINRTIKEYTEKGALFNKKVSKVLEYISTNRNCISLLRSNSRDENYQTFNYILNTLLPDELPDESSSFFSAKKTKEVILNNYLEIEKYYLENKKNNKEENEKLSIKIIKNVKETLEGEKECNRNLVELLENIRRIYSENLNNNNNQKIAGLMKNLKELKIEYFKRETEYLQKVDSLTGPMIVNIPVTLLDEKTLKNENDSKFIERILQQPQKDDIQNSADKKTSEGISNYY